MRPSTPQTDPTKRIWVVKSIGAGARFTLFGQLTRSCCTFASLLILARLLMPEDFGLVAMVTVFIGLGEVVRDLGLSTASVQAVTVDDRQRSNLFWMNVLIGVAFCLALLLLSPALAYIYGEPSIAPISAVLSATFLLNGFSSQHRAIANRQMHFGRLAAIDTLPPIFGVVVAITMAIGGAGVWALVAQQVVTALFGLLLAWLLVPWLPRSPSRGARMRGFVGFGFPLVGAQLLGYVSRSIDTAVMGLTFGTSAAGLYDRAFQVVMVPLNQMMAPSTRVALPALARNQGHPKEMGRLLRRGQGALLHPVSCFLALIITLSPSAVPLFLGDRWSALVPFVQVLSIGGLAQTAAYSSYWAFLSYGKTCSNLKYALCSRPIVIAAIFIGSTMGPIWIAVGYSVGLLCIWPLAFFWVRNFPGLDALAMFCNGVVALLTYIPGVIAGSVASRLLFRNGHTNLSVFLLGALSFALVAVLSILSAPSARSSWDLVFRRLLRS